MATYVDISFELPTPACAQASPPCMIASIAPYTIAIKEANDGVFEWKIPANLPEVYATSGHIVVSLYQSEIRGKSAEFTIFRSPNPRALEIVSSQMPNGKVGELYGYMFQATGGQGQLSWSVSTAPAINGIYIKPTGMFVATPRNAGGYAVTVTVKDSAGQSAIKDLRWIVTAESYVKPHPEGSLVSGLFGVSSSVGVIENGVARPFPNAEVFLSHGYRWDKVVKANDGDLVLRKGANMDYASGTLLRSKLNPGSFFLMYPSNVIRAFSSMDSFASMGYRGQVSYVANPAVYKSGNVMTLFDSHPPGTDINDGGTIYRITINGTRVTYPSIAVYNTWHTTDNDFTRVLPANGFDRLLPISGTMLPRDVVSAISVGSSINTQM